MLLQAKVTEGAVSIEPAGREGGGVTRNNAGEGGGNLRGEGSPVVIGVTVNGLREHGQRVAVATLAEQLNALRCQRTVEMITFEKDTPATLCGKSDL